MQFIAYTRVSTTEQGNSRNGLEGQDRAIQAFILAGHHTLLASFSEVASGKQDLHYRHVLRAAMAETKKLNAVLLVSKLDRLSRSVEFISNLMNQQIRFITVEDGLTVEPMMLHMKAVFAEQERRLISERTKAGLASTRARGTALGFAAHKDSTGRDKAKLASAAANKANAVAFAKTVAPSIKLLISNANMTYQQVANHLNTLGVKSERNGLWYASTVSNTLKHLK